METSIYIYLQYIPINWTWLNPPNSTEPILSTHHCLMRLRRPQHVLEGVVPLGGARDAWRVAEGGAPEALGSEKGVGNATGFNQGKLGSYHDLSDKTGDLHMISVRKLAILWEDWRVDQLSGMIFDNGLSKNQFYQWDLLWTILSKGRPNVQTCRFPTKSVILSTTLGTGKGGRGWDYHFSKYIVIVLGDDSILQYLTMPISLDPWWSMTSP